MSNTKRTAVINDEVYWQLSVIEKASKTQTTSEVFCEDETDEVIRNDQAAKSKMVDNEGSISPAEARARTAEESDEKS